MPEYRLASCTRELWSVSIENWCINRMITGLRQARCSVFCSSPHCSCCLSYERVKEWTWAWQSQSSAAGLGHMLLLQIDNHKGRLGRFQEKPWAEQRSQRVERRAPSTSLPVVWCYWQLLWWSVGANRIQSHHQGPYTVLLNPISVLCFLLTSGGLVLTIPHYFQWRSHRVPAVQETGIAKKQDI